MAKLPQNALSEFIGESQEMLEGITQALARVERGAGDQETLASIYRAMHTVKGSAQLFGFQQIGQLAHALEACLDPVRRGVVKLDATLTDLTYASLDVISTMLAAISRTGKEPDCRARLQTLIPALAEASVAMVQGGWSIPKDAAPSLDAARLAPPPLTVTRAADPREKLNDGAPMMQKRETEAKDKDVVTESRGEASQPETIRVHVDLLDNLMNLVGELVLIRNQVLQVSKSSEDPDFFRLCQRLSVLTGELQSEVMKTRMQPIGNILNKFQRVVRDMARDLGKRIDLKVEGAETELDKTLIEAVKDPLTHLVRNAIDHGIEPPAERTSAGKSDAGTITVRAYHESGRVLIEIADDGKGLDRQKIGTKALERNIVTPEALARMSDRDVFQLIFLPGFSTAEKVSNISGRGVGMDVVKTNIERIGGTVDLSGSPGKGVVVRMKIPLTLAIVPALIVRAHKERYAIPQSALVELIRLGEGDGTNGVVEILHGKPVFRLRGKLLPLVSLAETLKIPGVAVTPEKLAAMGANIAVLSADRNLFGLIVDDIEDSADIVVKPLSPFLKKLSVFSGSTIMGDGAVSLTLDVMGLADVAGIGRDYQERNVQAQAAPGQPQTDIIEYLFVDVGAPGKYAIPLVLVSRLEEFDSGAVEYSGDQRVVRYRDSLLPLISLPNFLKLAAPKTSAKDSSEKLSVIVVKKGERNFGIEVNAILDVLAIAATIDRDIRDRIGILGTMIVNEEVVVVADVLGIIAQATAHLVASTPNEVEAAAAAVAARRSHRLVVAEDSPFFRKQIVQLFNDAGYQVAAAPDGAAALQLLEAAGPGEFSLLVSDIEMPLMNGFELARAVRAHQRHKDLPLVAITSRFSQADRDEGARCGFTAYLEKLNSDQLIATVDGLLTTIRGNSHASAG